MEVITKMPASQVVDFVSRFAVERGPKAVCEPCRRKRSQIGALALLQQDDDDQQKTTMTWMVVTRIITIFLGTSGCAGETQAENFGAEGGT